jgi:hypothetical protein
MTQPDSSAPHGRDGNGTPLAPYGLNVDGSPRKSNRGARAGQRKSNGPASARKSSAAPTVAGSSLSDADRKGMLCELADMMLTSPLASASQVPFVVNRFGPKQSDALAGDAFILSQYFPGIADGLILLSKTKPHTLAWLDKLEENAPMVVLTNALLRAGKAIADNHINPNPRVAQAGRSLAALRMAQMAEAVNAQAAAMAPDFTPEDFEKAAYDRTVQEDPTVLFAAA